MAAHRLKDRQRCRQVSSLDSFVLRWQTRASRTPACSPGKAEPPDCWPDCWGLVHQAGTEREKENTGEKTGTINRIDTSKAQVL